MLKQLVNELTGPTPSSNSAGNRNGKRKKRKNKKLRNNDQGDRGMNPRRRNPGQRSNVALSLTRDQFTASSPLNLFEITKASTPGGIRVRGRELIGAVTLSAASTGVFQVANIAGQQSLFINPGTFPRLAAYNPIYEMFKFHNVMILFQSNQPTTVAGEIALCVDYDVKDTAPASIVNVMRNISSTMSNIYSDCSLEALSSLSRLPKYNTAQTTTPDLNQYIQAVAYASVEGYTGASGATVGYIIAQYDVEFFTPQ